MTLGPWRAPSPPIIPPAPRLPERPAPAPPPVATQVTEARIVVACVTLLGLLVLAYARGWLTWP